MSKEEEEEPGDNGRRASHPVPKQAQRQKRARLIRWGRSRTAA